MWRDLWIFWFYLLNLQGLCNLGALVSHKPHAGFRKDSVIAHHRGVKQRAGDVECKQSLVLLNRQ